VCIGEKNVKLHRENRIIVRTADKYHNPAITSEILTARGEGEWGGDTVGKLESVFLQLSLIVAAAH
jgi:hypothetical protein